MNILHIANGYFGNRLYKELFARQRCLENKIQVFVPMDKKFVIPQGEPTDIFCANCFRQVDRLLFYSKQRKMLLEMEKHWDVTQFDVIHAHTVFSGGYSAWRLHKKYEVPYIAAVRDTDVNVFFRKMVHLRKIGVQILSDAAAVVFLSPAYLDTTIHTYVPRHLQEKIRSKSLVIPNGIADLFVTDRFGATSVHTDELQLLFVGALCKRKNVETAISAVKYLNESGSPARLTVIGAIQEKQYQNFSDAYPFVTYLGKQLPEKVKEVMRQSDIFVLPSHTETFGVVYAEAMSQGLPVLYTRGQGFDGHFPEGTVGYAVDDRDPADIAEKIKRIVSDYDRIAKNAYEKSSQFSWDTIVEQYSQLYKKISKN